MTGTLYKDSKGRYYVESNIKCESGHVPKTDKCDGPGRAIYMARLIGIAVTKWNY